MTTELLRWAKTGLAGGRYQVAAVLGQGGMGTVLRARDRNLETDVVIKVPRPELLQEPEFTARFAAEIRSLVKLAHPHIVRVIDVGQQAGVPFVVLQHLPGGSLEERRSQDRKGRFTPMPPQQLRDWLPDVAAALDFIHTQGYVHRDVKPANLLFDEHGNVYLSDFGIAKAVVAGNSSRCTSLTGSGMVVGTPQYMAPEVILGKPFDGAADQYALGVLVFELLAGRPPFEEATGPALFVAHTTRPAPSLSELMPKLPRALTGAVDRALEKEPRQRHANCAALARAVLTVQAPVRSVRASVLKTSVVAAPVPPRDPVLPTGTRRGKTFTCPKCGESVAAPRQTSAGNRLRCFACDALFAGSAAAAELAGQSDPRHREGAVERPAKPRAETTRSQQAKVDTRPHSVRQPTPQPRPEPIPSELPRGTRGWLPLAVGGGAFLLLALGIAWTLWPTPSPEPIPLSLASSTATEKEPARPEANLELLPMSPVQLQAGAPQDVTITVRRNGLEGLIDLQLAGLPGRVEVRPAKPIIAAGSSTTTVQFVAEADAPEADRTVGVFASLGTRSVRSSLRVAVMRSSPPPPVEEKPWLILNPLAPVLLEAGAEQEIAVAVERHRFNGPLQVEVEGTPGIACPSVMIPANQDRATLRLKVREETADGVQHLRVIVRSNGLAAAEGVLALTVKTRPAIVLEFDRDKAFVRRGEEGRGIEVRVRRRGFVGPIRVRLEGLPAGVTVKPLPTGPDPAGGRVVPSDQSRAFFVLEANDKAVLGAKPFRLVAQADQAETTANLSLLVGEAQPVSSTQGSAPQVEPPMRPALTFAQKLEQPVTLNEPLTFTLDQWVAYLGARYQLNISIRDDLFRRRGFRSIEDREVKLGKQRNVPLASILDKLAAEVFGRCHWSKPDRVEIIPNLR